MQTNIYDICMLPWGPPTYNVMYQNQEICLKDLKRYLKLSKDDVIWEGNYWMKKSSPTWVGLSPIEHMCQGGGFSHFVASFVYIYIYLSLSLSLFSHCISLFSECENLDTDAPLRIGDGLFVDTGSGWLVISKLLTFSLFEATQTEDDKELSNEAGPKRCETRCMKISSTYMSILL